jgi:hypothetical protein
MLELSIQNSSASVKWVETRHERNMLYGIYQLNLPRLLFYINLMAPQIFDDNMKFHYPTSYRPTIHIKWKYDSRNIIRLQLRERELRIEGVRLSLFVRNFW